MKRELRKIKNSEKCLEEIFEGFNKLNVLIIGDVMIDSYLWGNVNRISPEAPVPIVSVTKKESRLGGAANVALNIKSMGANPILCSVIGGDESGKLFFELLKSQNLSTCGIIESKNRITTVKTRVIGGSNQMLRIDHEIESPIVRQEMLDLWTIIEKTLLSKGVDVIIFEDYDKGCISDDLIKRTIALARGNKIPIVVDPKKKNFMSYRGVTLFKPNLKELKEGLKLDFDSDDIEELKKVATKFIKKQKIDNLLITLSERGIYIHSKKTKKIIGGHIRNVSDVSGAGDTVISIAALCLALNLPPIITATLANLAGGLVCEGVGVVTLDKNQLLSEALKLKFY